VKGGELADVVERAAKVVLNLLAGAEQVPVLAKESERLANKGKGSASQLWSLAHGTRVGKATDLRNLVLAVVGLARHGAVEVRHAQAEMDQGLLGCLLQRPKQVNWKRAKPAFSITRRRLARPVPAQLTDGRLEAPRREQHGRVCHLVARARPGRLPDPLRPAPQRALELLPPVLVLVVRA